MPLPGRREWIFSIKMFAACMMALAAAFVLDLPHPSWSMMTIFIVAQPLAGMVQSKALYRLAGTVVGSVAAVFIVVVFAGSPELQTLALAVWLGWCVYVTVIHRTPSGYVVMLAGYTASFIAFPSVDAPDTIFTTALARVEEIALGILCAVVVDMTIFPRRVGPMLQARLDAWLADAMRWTVDVLTGHAADGDSGDAKAAAGRLNGLFLRLGSAAASTPITHALAGLRVGLNILRLRSLAAGLPPDALRVQDAVLEALSRHFRGLDGPASLASIALRDRLDGAIASLSVAEATPATTDALLALVGIRHALFRHVDFFDVEPVPTVEAAEIAG